MRGFELLKTHVIYKEKSRASKIKSGTETSMIYKIFALKFYFGTLHFGISIVLLLW